MGLVPRVPTIRYLPMGGQVVFMRPHVYCYTIDNISLVVLHTERTRGHEVETAVIENGRTASGARDRASPNVMGLTSLG
jgi:hypothetical protein